MDEGVGDRRPVPPLIEPREGETPSLCADTGADADAGGGESERRGMLAAAACDLAVSVRVSWRPAQRECTNGLHDETD